MPVNETGRRRGARKFVHQTVFLASHPSDRNRLHCEPAFVETVQKTQLPFQILEQNTPKIQLVPGPLNCCKHQGLPRPPGWLWHPAPPGRAAFLAASLCSLHFFHHMQTHSRSRAEGEEGRKQNGLSAPCVGPWPCAWSEGRFAGPGSC